MVRSFFSTRIVEREISLCQNAKAEEFPETCESTVTWELGECIAFYRDRFQKFEKKKKKRNEIIITRDILTNLFLFFFFFKSISIHLQFPWKCNCLSGTLFTLIEAVLCNGKLVDMISN